MDREARSKAFLRQNILVDFRRYWGFRDVDFIEEVVSHWFDDDRNYDGRWSFIEHRMGRDLLEGSKILDMASGCGTFVFYGLRRGYDVWGIEPEPWKLEFVRYKIADLQYPVHWKERFVSGLGENLPFRDRAFDLITTYQTLEHVRNVEACLHELLRVLRGGGVLYVIAPDYNGLFEGHYRVPFLPQMNRRLAELYLSAIRRPTRGLDTIQYTTTDGVVKRLKSMDMPLHIEDLNRTRFLERDAKIQMRLPLLRNARWAARVLNYIYGLKLRIARTGRRENTICLWVTKSDV